MGSELCRSNIIKLVVGFGNTIEYEIIPDNKSLDESYCFVRSSTLSKKNYSNKDNDEEDKISSQIFKEIRERNLFNYLNKARNMILQAKYINQKRIS